MRGAIPSLFFIRTISYLDMKNFIKAIDKYNLVCYNMITVNNKNKQEEQ